MVTVTDAQSNPNQASELIEQLKASGALDELFSKIDSGEVELTGDGGLVPALIKETLERGLQAEMTSHLGYGRPRRQGDGQFPQRLLCQDRRVGGRRYRDRRAPGPGRVVHPQAGAEGLPAVGWTR